MHGEYNSDDDPDEIEEGVIHITKGFSKDHAPELNQVVLQLISSHIMSDIVRDLLAINIKRYRISFGYSQEKLAELAEVSTSFIAAIETCKKFPSSGSI